MRRSCYPLVTAALLLAGCAQMPTSWQKPGASQQEFAADSYACDLDVQQYGQHTAFEYQGRNTRDTLIGGLVGALVVSAGDGIANAGLHEKCLMAHGWMQVAADQQLSEKSVAAGTPGRQRFGARISDDMSVDAVQPGDVAARAGIMPGDTIVTFGGRNLNSPSDLQSAVSETPAGQTKEIDIFRGDQHLTVMASF